MQNVLSKDIRRRQIHLRVRKRIVLQSRLPRLNVYRSLNHIYAQLVDDANGHTLVSASSLDKEIRKSLKTGGNLAAAKTVGKALAERAVAKGIERVVFDRGGYSYHGRVKALADTARESGLKF